MEPVFIQILSALPLLDYFADFYRQVIPEADTRTTKWFLMSSPDVPVTIIVVYLFVVIVLRPFLMQHERSVAVRKLLILYNSAVLLLNLWLGISFSWHIYRAGYQLGCQRIRKHGKHESSIASLLWIFHCSKIIELIDTLFLVLKRKENQLSFLHLYHHSTIVMATWIGVRFVPGGSSAVIAMVNSWIHVFMYFYYEMMVLGVKSFQNYKKCVTILQIVQFLATIVHCTSALRKNCGYPKWILTWLLLYMISFLVLFIHFYVQTYWKPKKNPDALPATTKQVEPVPTKTLIATDCTNSRKEVAFSDDDEDSGPPSSRQHKNKNHFHQFANNERNGMGIEERRRFKQSTQIAQKIDLLELGKSEKLASTTCDSDDNDLAYDDDTFSTTTSTDDENDDSADYSNSSDDSAIEGVAS